jgi:cytochrome b pre-mRNA-processing protein 3
LLALTDIRLGQGGRAARERAPRLAECFIADMDVQMREAGFGDPGLGKQVRMMVGSLASRVERWRGAIRDEASWRDALLASLYRDEPAESRAVESGEAMVRDWWAKLLASSDEALAEGKIG